MERRKFLKTGSVAAVATAGLAAASSLPAPAIAQRKRRLKMTLAFPKGFPATATMRQTSPSASRP